MSSEDPGGEDGGILPELKFVGPASQGRFSKVSCLQKGDILATWTLTDAFTEGISSIRSSYESRSRARADATGGRPGWISRIPNTRPGHRRPRPLPHRTIQPCVRTGPVRRPSRSADVLSSWPGGVYALQWGPGSTSRAAQSSP